MANNSVKEYVVQVCSGPHIGRMVSITVDRFVMGRSINCDLALTGDLRISRHHAALVRNGERWFLQDLDSRNGTFVFGARIQEMELQLGLPFWMGDTWVILTTRDKLLPIPKMQDETLPAILQNEAPNVFERTPTWLAQTKTLAGLEILQETVVVIDLANSSRMFEAGGDQVSFFVRERLKSLIEHLSAHFEVLYWQTTGDGALLTFPTTTATLGFLESLNKAIESWNSSVDIRLALRIRVGVARGEVNVDEHGDRFGRAVDLAFRLEGLRLADPARNAPGPENNPTPRILVTSEVATGVKDRDPYSVESIGAYELKGFTERVEIFWLAIKE